MEKPSNEIRRKEGAANPRSANRLTAAAVRAAKVGRHGDGNGLSLIVTAPDRKHWQFRYMRNLKGREMSLGNAAHVTLAEARQRAAECHKLLSRLYGFSAVAVIGMFLCLAYAIASCLDWIFHSRHGAMILSWGARALYASSKRT